MILEYQFWRCFKWKLNYPVPYRWSRTVPFLYRKKKLSGNPPIDRSFMLKYWEFFFYVIICKKKFSFDWHTNNLVILPGNYKKKWGKQLIFYFCLQSFFQHFKCDHHFLFNLEEKIKQHNNITISLLKVSRCCGMLAGVTQSKIFK